MTYILSKKNYLIFSLLYTSFRFLLDNQNERITQLIFFLVSILYLVAIFLDDYKRFLNKDLVISYLILFFAIISVIINKKIDFVSIRALLMLVINFIGLTVDDLYDKDYFKTIEQIVFLIMLISIIHNVICLAFCVTDILKITSFQIYRDKRLYGLTFVNATGEIALLGIGSIIFFLEKINYNRNNKLFYFCVFNIFLNALVSVLTQNRISMYGLPLCVILYIILKIMKEGKIIDISNIIKSIIVIIVVIGILYSILVSLNIFRIRKFSIFSKERVDIWIAYLSVFVRENMVLGLGPGKALQIFREILGNNPVQNYINYFGDKSLASWLCSFNNYFESFMPHNEYLRHMVMFGFVGLALIFVYIFNVIYKLYRIYRYGDSKCAMVCYLSVFYLIFPLISGLVENTFSFTNSPRYFVSFTFFFMVGYIYKMNNAIKVKKV